MPDGAFSHQEDLRALMDGFGVERFHLIGLSMGGSISVDYAVVRPDDLLSLTLLDSNVGGPLSRAASAFGEIARRDNIEAARAAWLADGLFVPARRDPAVTRRLDEIVGAYSGWHWTAERIEQVVPGPPAAERLHTITAPTLVVVGALDVPRMQDYAATLSKIPGARTAVIADAGHMVNMEKPAEVNAVLLDFLDSLRPGGDRLR
jgi:pimeloyl-ACP methyl ester carboxylesterase